MDFDFNAFEEVEKDLNSLFHKLSITESKIHQKLEKLSDGKGLKGNELVGWLGEIYTKLIFGGHLVDDSHEHDVVTQQGLRVSVKTRKGTRSGWTRSSAIPKMEGGYSPTHLMFVHLNDNYSASRMWLYPWKDLLKEDRFKKHIVRGKFRSYYMSVIPSKDSRYEIYPA